MPPSRPLEPERDALSHVLARLIAEEPSLESLCKHTPRIVSVAANVARIQAALETTTEPDETDVLRTALRELTVQDANEEDHAW